MQPASDSKANRSFNIANIVPKLRHTVPWRLASVTSLPDARLRVVFVDATEGQVDLSALLNSPQVTGTVFEPLRDPAVFAQVKVVQGAVQWPNGAELAPDAMYDMVREHGQWVVE